ncbi:hypothetical protein LQV63_02510 [Paenibacillus profundus]|uniref:Uncharacterized protein n=1 Tax=Paenibacillus profundus TaxID=1173085 RepID=A0ABS8YAJ7_9BACL|nr:hypothetical protein [Paenibacillus profundus]MCE5168194.1 hypothetical protein [Paenibacillus profundus]
MRKKSFFQSLIRKTAMVAAFLIFFLTATHTYALNAQADLQFNHSQIELKDDNSSRTDISDYPDSHGNDSMFVVPALPWIGWGIGQLIGWLTAGAAVTIVTIELAGETYAFVNEMAEAISKSKKEDKPRFYVAKSRNGNKEPLLIGKPLGEGEAELWLKASIHNEVWAVSDKDAKGLAMRVGQGKFVGPENHWQTGTNDTLYYDHYHSGDDYSTYRTSYIFYGTNSFLG